MKKFACMSLLLVAMTYTQEASAQWGGRRHERNASAWEANRSAAQLHDDVRDLRRFQRTLAAFDDAWRRQDAYGVRAALQSFVAQGRAEVAEQQRETHQAANEARRSQHEAWRDQSGRDRRDARDDRRDFRRESAELAQESALLNELERAAAAELAVGPRMPVLVRAREAMVRFIQLAEIEVRRSHRELREDNRELREDQRNMRRYRRY